MRTHQIARQPLRLCDGFDHSAFIAVRPVGVASARRTLSDAALACMGGLVIAIAMVALTATAAHAAEAPPPTEDQVIVPQVDRRPIKVPHIPSNDIEMGIYSGTYASQNFGSSAVVGVRVGYHITEDFFVEGVYGQTKVTDVLFRQILPAGIFPQQSEKLSYYNLSAGVNVLPGEIFLWRNKAFASTVYLIGGIGSTSLDAQRHQTFNFGMGVRLFLTDWAALQVDMRDHIFSIDLLGTRQNTQNLEWTGGLTLFF